MLSRFSKVLELPQLALQTRSRAIRQPYECVSEGCHAGHDIFDDRGVHSHLVLTAGKKPREDIKVVLVETAFPDDQHWGKEAGLGLGTPSGVSPRTHDMDGHVPVLVPGPLEWLIEISIIFGAK